MREPENSKFFIQLDRREAYSVRRGYMNIPSIVREFLEKKGWKNKDRVWILPSDKGDYFIVFHTYEDYIKYKKRQKR